MNILFSPAELPSPTPNVAWSLPNAQGKWTVREITVAGAADKGRVHRALFAALQQAAFGERNHDDARPDTNATDLWAKTTAIMETGTRAQLPAVVFRGPAWELGTIVHGLVVGESGLGALPHSCMSTEHFARHAARPALLGAVYVDLSSGGASVTLPEHCTQYDPATDTVIAPSRPTPQ